MSESVWALIWALGLVPKLDFAKPCPHDLVRMLPNLQDDREFLDVRSRAEQRSTDELAAAADLAYCLHWSVTDASLRGDASPGRVPAWIVVERRRALEWMLSDEDWDDVPLDT